MPSKLRALKKCRIGADAQSRAGPLVHGWYSDVRTKCTQWPFVAPLMQIYAYLVLNTIVNA